MVGSKSRLTILFHWNFGIPSIMKDTHLLPILISGTSSGVLLQRVPLTGSAGSGAYDEDWLQKLLFSHPEAIPVAEINDTFSGLIPICRELATPAGPIDILYATRSGRIAVLEAKLWRNPEARRKVICQILDYAKELSHWTYETASSAGSDSRSSLPNGAMTSCRLPGSPTSNSISASIDSCRALPSIWQPGLMASLRPL